MRRAALLLLAAAAAGGAGCGTSGDPADDVRGTVDAFLLNCERGDGVLAQETLTSPGRRVFVDLPGAGAGCARILRLPRAGPDFARARVTSVATVGSRATAQVAFPGAHASVSLSRGAEGWLIEGPH